MKKSRRIYLKKIGLARDFAIIIICLLIVSCGSSRNRRGWSELGEPANLLTEQLEIAFDEDMPNDTVEQFIKRMELIGGEGLTPTQKKHLQSRLLFWKGRLMLRKGDTDSAKTLLIQSLEKVDSATNLYDNIRIRLLLIPYSEQKGSEAYNFYSRARRFGNDYKVRSIEVRALLNLGNLMNQIGEPNEALRYYDSADSIFSLEGRKRSILKNRINRAPIMQMIGNKDSAIRLLRSVIAEPSMRKDAATYNLVLRNLFVVTDSIEYLRAAQAHASEVTSNEEIHDFINEMGGYWWIRHGNADSARIYSEKAIKQIERTTDPNKRAIICLTRSMLKYMAGDSDSAYLYRLQYENELDSALNRRQAGEVRRLNTLNDIRRRESFHQEMNYRRNLYFGMIILSLIAIATIVSLILIRRNARQKIESMQRELALQQTRRKADAAALTIENQERVLSEVRDSLADMRKTGNLPDMASRRLETEIKMMLSQSEENRLELEMYETLHPEFIGRLKEAVPGLAQSYLKIAIYILLGLDNKRIAQLMNIRPESVRQSRWRLGQRLSLPDDTTLEEYLKQLNK